MPELRGRRNHVAADLPLVHETRSAALHRRGDGQLLAHHILERALSLRELDLQRLLLDLNRPRRALLLALAVLAFISHGKGAYLVELPLELRSLRSHIVADLPLVDDARSAVLHRRRNSDLAALHAGDRGIGHREFDLQRQFVDRHGPFTVHRHLVGIHAAVGHRVRPHPVERVLELGSRGNDVVADLPLVNDILVPGHDRGRDEHLLARQAGDGLLLVRELDPEGRALDCHRIVLLDLSDRVRSLEMHVIGAFGPEHIGHRGRRGHQFSVDEPVATERPGTLDHRLETHGIVDIGRHGGFRDGEGHLRHDGRLFARRIVVAASPQRSQSHQQDCLHPNYLFHRFSHFRLL